MELIKEVKSLLKQNIREYGMYIALVVIMAVFTIGTKGLFLSSRNISNLINQTGYIAVLAVGMTLVIVIKHIDLSVGFTAGFLGAVAAIMLSQWGLSVVVVIPVILLLGVIVGMYNGVLVAKLGIPAFVASLSGMMIFRGALLRVTEGTGTIIVKDKVFNAIGNGFIPDIGGIEGIHLLTIIIGALTVGLYVISEIKSRKKGRNISLMFYHHSCLEQNWFLYQRLLPI